MVVLRISIQKYSNCGPLTAPLILIGKPSHIIGKSVGNPIFTV